MTSLEAVRARFTSSRGLPFAEVLTDARILEVLDEHKVEYRDRVFGPLTTICFLSQVLSEDHSCRDAVARHRPPRRIRSGAVLAQRRQLLQRTLAPAHWRVAHPGQAHRPAVAGRAAPGVEVERPGRVHRRRLARLQAVAAYAGKGTGETTLLRQMYGSLSPGDVVVADALFDDYSLIGELRQRGVDFVGAIALCAVGVLLLVGVVAEGLTHRPGPECAVYAPGQPEALEVVRAAPLAAGDLGDSADLEQLLGEAEYPINVQTARRAVIAQDGDALLLERAVAG